VFRGFGLEEERFSMAIRLFVLLLFSLCCSCSAEEAVVSKPSDKTSTPTGETITIPLTEIWSTNRKRMWALNEPVTKYFGDVLKGDPANQSLLAEIKKALAVETLETKADSAFAVSGSFLAALKNAHAVLAGKQERPTSLSADSSISIAFFSLESPYYISITDVQIRREVIRIKYEYILHITEDMSRLFALIPLGKLSSGHYRVEIDHEPFEKRFSKFRKSGPHELMLGRVSTSFEFDIK
jgi:hypothetical protein